MKGHFPWRGVAVGLAFGAVLGAVMFLRFGCSDEDRQACRDHGGRVLDVRGGKGGWVCDEPTPSGKPR